MGSDLQIFKVRLITLVPGSNTQVRAFIFVFQQNPGKTITEKLHRVLLSAIIKLALLTEQEAIEY